MKLEMPRSLSGAGQGGHDHHELGKAGSVSVGQHLGGHGDEGAEEDGAGPLAHLTGGHTGENKTGLASHSVLSHEAPSF